MSMMEWAENEVKIACEYERANSNHNSDFDGDWDYGCACYESAIKAFKSLCSDRHSGMSIGITTHILNRLIEGKCLTPIKDTEDIWNSINDDNNNGYTCYQCKRMSSLFKYVYSDGTVRYSDNNHYYCIDIDDNHNIYHNGFVSNLVDKMFPITMPYYPASRPMEVYCEEFLTDVKNGDFDTIAILFIKKSDGTKIEINRFFDGSGEDWIEIDKDEYNTRKENRVVRMV